MPYGRWTVDQDESLLWTDEDGYQLSLTLRSYVKGMLSHAQPGKAHADLIHIVHNDGQLAALVRALAESDPHEDDAGWCHYCDYLNRLEQKPDHEPDCLWRRAREWVEAQQVASR